jgi:hypothetical protein
MAWPSRWVASTAGLVLVHEVRTALGRYQLSQGGGRLFFRCIPASVVALGTARSPCMVNKVECILHRRCNLRKRMLDRRPRIFEIASAVAIVDESSLDFAMLPLLALSLWLTHNCFAGCD